MTGGLVALGLTVFAVIFLFEIVDRTNFATISLAGKHPAKQVWTGAALAFTVSSAISVGIGAVVVAYLPAYLMWVKLLGGAILIAFGLRAVLGGDGEEEERSAEEKLGPVPPRRVVLTAFALILFLEMGDNTQILTFEFVAYAGPSPGAVVLLVVFVAATLALWCTAAVGALSGRFLRSRVPAEKLERVLGAILVAIGAVTIALAIDPTLLPIL